MRDDEKLNAARRALLDSGIRVGDMWVHVKTGGHYRIAALAVEEKSLTPVVVYSGSPKDSALAWTRPLAEFADGRFVPESGYLKQPSDIPKE